MALRSAGSLVRFRVTGRGITPRAWVDVGVVAPTIVSVVVTISPKPPSAAARDDDVTMDPCVAPIVDVIAPTAARGYAPCGCELIGG